MAGSSGLTTIADKALGEVLSQGSKVRLRYFRSPSDARLDSAVSLLGEEALDRLSGDAFLDLIPLFAAVYPDAEKREAMYSALVYLALAQIDADRLSELLNGGL